jgi:hypothetical protein
VLADLHAEPSDLVAEPLAVSSVAFDPGATGQ